MYRPTHPRASLMKRHACTLNIRLGLLPFVMALGISCAPDQKSPVDPVKARGAAPSINDGAHQGNEHFYFLPPLVSQPTVRGVSDENASPTVLICEWNAAAGPSGQCTNVIAQFSRASGTGAEVVRYSATDQQYIVNWNTDQCSAGACALDPSKSYRLRVLVAATELGHTDLQVVLSSKQVKNVDANEYIGLVDGRTLPIKFRIEQGAVSLVAPGSTASIGSTGGQVAASDGQVALSIPPGALSSSKSITIDPATQQLPGTGAWSTPVELGPDGTQFATPVRLSLAYDLAALPAGVIPEALRMVTWVDDHWEEVPGSVLNPADGTVTAAISHFSTYSLAIWPNVVTSGVSPNFLLVGQSTTMGGLVFAWQTYPATYCYPSNPRWIQTSPFSGYWYYPPPVCTTYTTSSYYYPTGMEVQWSSSNPGVAAVAAPAKSVTVNGQTTSPMVAGIALGSTTITARAGNLTSSVTTTVATPPVINPFPQGGTQLILPVVPGTSASVDAPISNLGGYPLTGLQVVGAMANCYTGAQYSWITTSFTPGTTAPTNLRVSASPPAGTALGVYDVCFTLRGTAAADRPYGTRVSVQQVVVPNPPVIDPFPQGGTQNIINVTAGATSSKDVPVGNPGGGTLTGLTFVGPVRNCYTGEVVPWLTYAWASTTAPTTLTLTATPPLSVAPGQYDLCFEIQARSVGAMDRGYGARVNVGAPVPLVFSVFGTGTNPFRKFGLRQGTGLVSIIPTPLASPLTVTLTHSNPSVASTNPTATIATGNTSQGVTVIAGTVAGRDTIIGSAPGYAPDTLVIETAMGRLLVEGWPSTLAFGDSAAIRIRPTNEDGVVDNAWFTSFALSSNGKLSFSRNSAPITSIAVQDGTSASPVFYVKGIEAGAATMTVTNSWYITSPYAVTVTPPPGPAITITDLGTLGGSGNSEAIGINDAGRIVGKSNNAAFYRDPSQSAPQLIPNPYGDLNEATDVTTAGLVQGHTPYVGWVYNVATGAFQSAPPAFTPTNRTLAYAINNAGQVLACADNGSFFQNFVWTLSSNATQLIPNAYNWCFGGINDAGFAVVSADPGAGGSTRLWNPTTQTATQLPSLGGVTAGNDINASNIVVGWSRLANGNRRAFRYEAATGQMQNLGTLGGAESEATGINDSGLIVGWSNTASGATHAFVWLPGTGQMYDLGTLAGHDESGANEISGNNIVVGYSAIAGVRRAVKWTIQ